MVIRHGHVTAAHIEFWLAVYSFSFYSFNQFMEKHRTYASTGLTCQEFYSAFSTIRRNLTTVFL